MPVAAAFAGLNTGGAARTITNVAVVAQKSFAAVVGTGLATLAHMAPIRVNLSSTSSTARPPGLSITE